MLDGFGVVGPQFSKLGMVHWVLQMVHRVLGVRTPMTSPTKDNSRVPSGRVVLDQAKARGVLIHFLPTIVTSLQVVQP